MRRLRIAVVGVGSSPESRSGGHLDAIQKMADRYDFCALCDLDRSRLDDVGERYGVKERFTNLDEMLRHAKPDVVYRLTPTDSTAMVCVKAAEAGCHVINEIPIGITLAMADGIIKACRWNKVKLEIAENLWLRPKELLKREIVRRGLLGTLTHARLKYPCGTYHGINTLRMIMGSDPVAVLGYAGQVEVLNQRAYGGDAMDRSFWEMAVLRFDNGVECIYQMPPKGRKWRYSWDIEGTHGQLYDDTLFLLDYEKAGDDPVEHFEGEREYPIEWVYEDMQGQQMLTEVRVNTDPPVVWQNPYRSIGITGDDQIAKAAILDSMYEAVTQDKEPRYGAASARRDYEAWIALRESALQDTKWIDLPLTAATEIERRINDEFMHRYGCRPDEHDKLVNVPFTRSSVIWTVAGWL